MLGELLKHRIFIWDLVHKEIRVRYAGSLVGLMWAIILPALTVLTFFLVFSSIMADRLRGNGGIPNFVIYLGCGIIPWSAFNEAAVRGCTVFVDHANLMKRVLFPRQLLLVQIVLATTLNLAIGFAVFLLILVITGSAPGPVVLWLPLIILMQMLFSFGFGLAIATLNVFFRDLNQLVTAFLGLWFWMTPIVYPVSILPPGLASLMRFNPLACLVDVYRDLILYSNPPDAVKAGLFFIVSLLGCAIGLAIYKRLRDEMVDAL